MQSLRLVAAARPHASLFEAPSRSFARVACQLLSAKAEASTGPFTAEECATLMNAVIGMRTLGGGAPVLRQTASSGHLYLLVEGWGYRARWLSTGARQITDVLLPGDFCTAVGGADAELLAFGRARIVIVRRDRITGSGQPALQRSWERAQAAEARILRDRLVSLGRRDAHERIAHFMCEIHARLAPVGMLHGDTFHCPLTQEQLADVLGLTPVHVNRVLQRLRSEGLLLFDKPTVSLPDLPRLRAAAGFDEGDW